MSIYITKRGVETRTESSPNGSTSMPCLVNKNTPSHSSATFDFAMVAMVVEECDS